MTPPIQATRSWSRPGTYRESVLVTESHLEIVGSRAAAIDAQGFRSAFGSGLDHLTGTRYVDNPVYGPYPVCSRNRRIDFNQVVGGGSPIRPSLDAGIYVGDDDQVTVRHNWVTNYVVGGGGGKQHPADRPG